MVRRVAETLENLPSWQAVCRTWAQERAEAEARTRWQVADAAPIPYNYRWIHVQEVVKLAQWLARETGADLDVVTAAAWLHDICKSQPQHALRGAEEAGHILPTTDFPLAKIDQVVAAIRVHEGLVRPESAPPLQPVEAAVLWDADKLSKLGVQALLGSLITEAAPGLNLQERRQGAVEFVFRVFSRTAMSMNTEAADKEANRRYAAMTLVLNMWAQDEAFPAAESQPPGGERN